MTVAEALTAAKADFAKRRGKAITVANALLRTHNDIMALCGAMDDAVPDAFKPTDPNVRRYFNYCDNNGRADVLALFDRAIAAVSPIKDLSESEHAK